jgi:hypothetical protein
MDGRRFGARPVRGDGRPLAAGFLAAVAAVLTLPVGSAVDRELGGAAVARLPACGWAAVVLGRQRTLGGRIGVAGITAAMVAATAMHALGWSFPETAMRGL